MKIPDVRKRLTEIAEALEATSPAQLAPRTLDQLAAVLRVLCSELRRRPSERTPPKSTPISDEVRAQIRAMSAQDPSLSQREIGEAININTGRISETLHGKRH